MGVRLKAAGPAGLKAASVLLLAASVLLLAAGGWLLAGAFLRSITYGLAVVLLAAAGWDRPYVWRPDHR